MLADEDRVTSFPASIVKVDPLATSILGKDNPVVERLADPEAIYTGFVLDPVGAVDEV